MPKTRPELRPDPNFRPNPQRALYVQGPVDQALVDRLTPKILDFQSAARDPITVYVDSPGGNTFLSDRLLKLLRSSTQDYEPPCHLITVVTGLAASAAADILCSGDYVLGYPNSTILYHGVRREEGELTMERASMLAEALRISNTRYAVELTKRAESRFLLRYFVYLKPKFTEFRSQPGRETADDISCFCGLLGQRLSMNASRLVAQAEERSLRYHTLFDKVLRKIGRAQAGQGSERRLQAAILKALLDFEVSSSRKDEAWSLRHGGLAQLNEDFSLLMEFLDNSHGLHFQHVCQRWGDFILSSEEKAHLANLSPASAGEKRLELARPHLLAPWALFVALCHSLQSGEHILTARDGFWLGLVDEVIGESDLPCTRMMFEYQLPSEETRK